jgi:tRNA(Ile)-lysidine synthase
MRGQTVKVREFFINEKISKRARDKWPLICAGNQIAWIPGYRISHTFRVTEETQLVLKLTMRKL